MGIYREQLAIHGIGGGAGGEQHGETGFQVRVETARHDLVIKSSIRIEFPLL